MKEIINKILKIDKFVWLFSALVYTLNPFVYSRFLAGHWAHLMASGKLKQIITDKQLIMYEIKVD